jgi:purine nucleoside phosphorylase
MAAALRLGIITGSGSYSLPGFESVAPRDVQTPFGAAHVNIGHLCGLDVVHLSRHLEGHQRLSAHVPHQANISALKQLGVDAVLAVTVCGACELDVELGSLVVFDDLHFVVNRLPDGSLCTLHVEEGAAGRGHWIYDTPYSEPLRRVLLEAAAEVGEAARDGGCYGHVDGPRFNTRAEIRALRAAGVTAVSQTAGPETVLCGEAELPYALVGYATDYANGVSPEPTPVEELARLIGASGGVFARVLAAAVPRIDSSSLEPVGTHFRFD